MKFPSKRIIVLKMPLPAVEKGKKKPVPTENPVLLYLQAFTYNCQLSGNYQKPEEAEGWRATLPQDTVDLQSLCTSAIAPTDTRIFSPRFRL